MLDLAPWNGWELIVTNYVLGETARHVAELHQEAREEWLRVQPRLRIKRTAWIIDSMAVFPNRKDKPVLGSAIRWADVLLTHDRSGFHDLLGTTFFRLRISTPGEFLKQQRASGVLKTGP